MAQKNKKEIINWETKGKTIRQLVHELLSFENIDVEVQISIGDEINAKPISLVGRNNGKCVLMHFEP